MFHLHRSERADALVDALVRVVGEPLDPFVAEVVAVPTRGVERWLTHRIAHTVGAADGRHDGVCANVAFPFPGRLVGDILATATGVDGATDPWRPERLVWAILAEMDAGLDDSNLGALARHIGGDGATTGDELRRGRRFATAQRIAHLFDRYSTFRPELVLSWANETEGNTTSLDPNDRWQPVLWRRVRARLARPSPAERLDPACIALAANAVELPLPDRISLFGLTRLPATYLQVLRAVAAHRDVHLFALHPSLALWNRLEAHAVTLPAPRTSDTTRALPRNPLLRTWGADTREMQLVLAAAVDAHHAHHPIPADPTPTLLAQIQSDIHGDRVPVGAPVDGVDQRLVLAPTDTSIQIHHSHGRARQVEIMRDAICHALVDDPTLEPRDIIVLCPDIDAFAPLLHAAFGAVAASTTDRGVPALPYRLADRSLRQTNPLLGALDALLDLVDSRHSAPDLLGLFGRDPVRRRFGFDDDDLDRIHGWVKSANVRWGLDAVDRDRFSLGTVAGNTWQAGIDRLLLGIAMDSDGGRMVDQHLPIDDVGSGDIDLVGRLAEAVDRVALVVDACRDEHDIKTWSSTLSDATDLLFATERDDQWMRVQVHDVLRDVLVDAGADADDQVPAVTLSLAEIRVLLADRLRGVPTRADFRTGAITMCTLVPMRAVPHRVVCILGLDDDAFPRATTVDGDDLLRREPRIGDPDQRTEDRQLLLDALLSATDRLIIATTGFDERTNEPRPPAVPLSELMQVIDATAIGADGEPARSQVAFAHALQPFDVRPHLPTRHGHPWAFDRLQLAGAEAAQLPRAVRAPFLATPLGAPTPPVRDVDIDTLTRFFAHPGREFLRQRLGVNTWDADERLPDAIPVELDGLERWGVGTRLVGHLIDGHTRADAQAIEAAHGAVPPGQLGDRILRQIGQTAEDLVTTARRRGILPDADAAQDIVSYEIDLRLPSGTSLTGTVPGVLGTTLGTVTFSSLKAKVQIDHWVRQLALTAAHPETQWSSVVASRYSRGSRVWSLAPVHVGEFDADAAQAWSLGFLDVLVDMWRLGMREPLPLPAETGAAWARRKGDPTTAAAGAWTSAWGFDREDKDPSWVRVLGGVLRLDQLLAFAPTANERGAGWDEDDPSRFSRLAHRLWRPIHERSGQ